MKKSICTAAFSAALLAGALTPAGAQAAPAPSEMNTKLAGRTVFLDPGHQAAAAGHNLAQPVDDGRGGTKECQTTGMVALGGMPEHTINWKVSQLVKASLESLGAKVVLSRPDDTGWGGCITDRARAANASGAQVAVSIHADGAPAANRGFHLIVPKLPIPDATANQVQSTKGMAASKAVREAYAKAGFTPANYAGAVNGMQTRADIAGPALTKVPNVFIEMGNGGNPDDAKMLTSAEGQIKHAVAITSGLVGYLLGVNPTGQSPAALDKLSAAPSGTPQAPGAGQTPSTEQGSGVLSGLGDTVTQLLQPLLQTLGIDLPNGTSALVGTLSGLVSKVLAAVLAK